MKISKFKNGESFKEATYQLVKRFDGLLTYKGKVIQYEVIDGAPRQLWAYNCPSYRITIEDAIKDAIFEKQYC